ncbi:MAG: FAD-dependent oxidoreductase [Alphaproteobacteria bacterium]|nr:MAG: FAD-dependent oxidoreductase [Alphaproteobacteria bacterium]
MLTTLYRPSVDQTASPPAHHPVVVIGSGPVGLAAAVDLALRGLPVVVLTAANGYSEGSRALCWAKRTLEILTRLGVGQELVADGVTWQLGKVFRGDRQVYSFDLLPEGGHQHPAFINLQQYAVEAALHRQAVALGVDIRWQSRVSDARTADDGVTLTIETPDGPYTLHAAWVIACDGARSSLRRLLGLEFQGRVFEDRFLIADVRMDAAFPTERWFWFDPPFHPGQSALLHRQPDNVWRIDLQLGWDADPEVERQPERIKPRLAAMLGPDRPFELVWASVYTFQCRRLERFRHGRVIFAGDSAHQVSPFGARGANSGIQDTDNLAWKLAAVIAGAPDRLLDSYEQERIAAADENILNSTRSTDFISPKGVWANALRNAVLDLAADHAFARPFVNSGRLSLPSRYQTSPLSTPDEGVFAGGPPPGAPIPDAPLDDGAWLLAALGSGFTLLAFAADLPEVQGVTALAVAPGVAWARFDAKPGTAYLIRPDGHVAARSRTPTPAWVAAAVSRAMGQTESHHP